MATGAEGLGVAAFMKWGIGVLGSLFTGGVFFWLRQNTNTVNSRLDKHEERLDNTYDKDEVKEQIDVRVEPLHKAIEHNTSAVRGLTGVLTDLRIDFASVKEKIGVDKDQR